MADNDMRPGTRGTRGNQDSKPSDWPGILAVAWKIITGLTCVIAIVTGISTFLSLNRTAKAEALAAFCVMLLAVAPVAILYFYIKRYGLTPKAIYVAIGALGVAILFGVTASIAAFRLESPGVTSQPTAGPSASHGSIGPPATIVIPMSAACDWAFPGQASGETVGSLYNIGCLGKNGQNLGGFSGIHSLNNWCAIPSHTDGENGMQPELLNEVWVCKVN